MSEVKLSGNYEQWIKFFLQALIESLKDTIKTINKLNNLHNTNVARILELGRQAKNIMLVYNYIEANPIIDVKKTSQALGIAFNTTASAINHLVDIGILVKTNNNSRNRLFMYKDYLNILRDGT